MAALLAVMLGLPLTGAAERFSFVAIGDVPYRVPLQFTYFERLIGRINQIRPAFTVHVGDIKNGSSRCDDERFQKIFAMFNTFDQPLVYTPGDNEWTDCHRADNGGYDPIERLNALRRLFFAQPGSLGRDRMPLEHQSADPKFGKFVENARWQRGGVWFATVHIIDSNNNLQRNQAAINEYIVRNAANLAWIDATFTRAIENKAPAVVVMFQADPWWELEGREDQRSGFTDTLAALKRNAIRFGRPVLIIHGGQHKFIIDKPLYLHRRLIYNATRLMVFGDNEVHGVLVNVDTDDADVFSFRTITVPQNIEPAVSPKKP